MTPPKGCYRRARRREEEESCAALVSLGLFRRDSPPATSARPIWKCAAQPTRTPIFAAGLSRRAELRNPLPPAHLECRKKILAGLGLGPGADLPRPLCPARTRRGHVPGTRLHARAIGPTWCWPTCRSPTAATRFRPSWADWSTSWPCGEVVPRHDQTTPTDLWLVARGEADRPLSSRLYAQFVRRRRHNEQQRAAAARPTIGLLAWSRLYLPDHFTLPPSAMHRWLGERLDPLHLNRGSKLNLIGPRGSEKHDRHVGLCASSRTRGLGILHLDRFRHDPAGLQPPGERQGRVDGQRPPAGAYPDAVRRRAVWRKSAIALRNSATIEGFGTGQRIRGRRRRATRRRSCSATICKMISTWIRLAARAHPALVPRNAAEGGHPADQRGDGPRRCTTMPWAGVGPNARLGFANLSLDRELAAESVAPWEAWEEIYCDVENPDSRTAARRFTMPIATRWTREPPCSGRKKRTSTR